VSEFRATFAAAEAACVANSGHLTSIADSAENTFVQGLASADFWFGAAGYRDN